MCLSGAIPKDFGKFGGGDCGGLVKDIGGDSVGGGDCGGLIKDLGNGVGDEDEDVPSSDCLQSLCSDDDELIFQ